VGLKFVVIKMSIDAYLEVENGKHLTLSDDFVGSTAIATFVEYISVYCEHEPAFLELHPSHKEDYNWFSKLASSMTEDLCVLNNVYYGFWEYNESEYERYVIEIEEYDPSSAVLSVEEFVSRCREFDDKWIDVENLKAVVDDLISFLETEKPPETWFYTRKDTLIDFQSLSDALLRVSERSYRRVRIYFR